MPVRITYGEGGYDPEKPYGNVVEIETLPEEGEEGEPKKVAKTKWSDHLNPESHTKEGKK